jgi:hypothetical protein
MIADEGLTTMDDEDPVTLPTLALLAVDGGKVVHQAVFVAPGPTSTKAVTFCPAAPGPEDAAGTGAVVATTDVHDAVRRREVISLQDRVLELGGYRDSSGEWRRGRDSNPRDA